MRPLFQREDWEKIARKLRGVSGAWWEENQDDLLGLLEDEAKDMLQSLRDGSMAQAKQAIAARLYAEDREAWVAYRKGTTAQLAGIARSRVRIMEALSDLGIRAARVIGEAAAGALGL